MSHGALLAAGVAAGVHGTGYVSGWEPDVLLAMGILQSGAYLWKKRRNVVSLMWSSSGERANLAVVVTTFLAAVSTASAKETGCALYYWYQGGRLFFLV